MPQALAVPNDQRLARQRAGVFRAHGGPPCAAELQHASGLEHQGQKRGLRAKQVPNEALLNITLTSDYR